MAKEKVFEPVEETEPLRILYVEKINKSGKCGKCRTETNWRAIIGTSLTSEETEFVYCCEVCWAGNINEN